MIYQFHTVNSRVFELNGVKHNRRFRVNEKDKSSVVVSDIHTGSILGIYQLGDVFVDGSPVKNWSQLEDVVYNYECVCTGGDDEEGVKGRIFDDTFDVTFE